ncbi:MAG: rod shape-determining protein MreC [Firmicutes bacterium GWF2_51_9]|nr:MAG: rod shape-determining protein MreC [Firmicutes bacterium GWF2_51_9]OGS58852.1 MAG: rod shape-determining protein MreC [Firmicutes bacterium GWE2_51_13]HAM62936.1 rod shape-determining protein MreC [Erysipelotrichaceae bacterium]HAO62305.1 rod shape-determining protein MreC [Erysipelotrichaceae bacterium]HBZ41030.1 rod shape-determining protein MreC [Erysipelotrichaceae bacterium]
MRKWTRTQRILIATITVLLSLTVFLNILRIASPLDGINAAGYDVFTMLRYSLIERPVTSIQEFVGDFTQLWKVKQENEKLRTQLELLAIYQAKLAEAYRQIEALKQIAGLELAMNDYELINGTVIYRPIEAFDNSLSINIGKNDGVKVDDAVISSKGLIGKVEEVFDDRSVVRLLTTESGNNKVTVKIQLSPSQTAEAILERYDVEHEAFEVRLVTTGYAITKGMSVISSGLGGVFPSGLLVGYVKEVVELDNAVGMNIYVSPAADFKSFEYVAVVSRR